MLVVQWKPEKPHRGPEGRGHPRTSETGLPPSPLAPLHHHRPEPRTDLLSCLYPVSISRHREPPEAESPSLQLSPLPWCPWIFRSSTSTAALPEDTPSQGLPPLPPSTRGLRPQARQALLPASPLDPVLPLSLNSLCWVLPLCLDLYHLQPRFFPASQTESPPCLLPEQCQCLQQPAPRRSTAILGRKPSYAD